MYQELFWTIMAIFQFQVEEVELKIKQPFRRGFVMVFLDFSEDNGSEIDEAASNFENMVEGEVVEGDFQQLMVDDLFQVLAEVLIGSLLVLMHLMEFLQLLYLSSTEQQSNEELEIYGIFQKIFLDFFKKASIFHYTYSDYAYPAYENHRPVHPLKMSHSSFLWTRDKFECCLPNSIVFLFFLPYLYQQTVYQSFFFHLNL